MKYEYYIKIIRKKQFRRNYKSRIALLASVSALLGDNRYI